MPKKGSGAITSKTINELITRASELRIEQEEITNELARRARASTHTKVPTVGADYEIGDRVIITNNYRGHRGLVGTIIRTSDKSVELSTSAGFLTKRKKNIRKEER